MKTFRTSENPKPPPKIETQAQIEESECVICMERKAQIVLPCTHAFCEDCLSVWRQKSATCPMCRTTISNNNDKSGQREEFYLVPNEQQEHFDMNSYLSDFLNKI